MINLKFNLTDLAVEARAKKTNILRVLFDAHIYKQISRETFELSGRSHSNNIVQIADYGLDYINVRIKTKGVIEKIGNGK